MEFDFNNVLTLEDVEHGKPAVGQRGFFADGLQSLRESVEKELKCNYGELIRTEVAVDCPFYKEGFSDSCWTLFYPCSPESKGQSELYDRQKNCVGRLLRSRGYDNVCLVTGVHLNDKGECFYILGDGTEWRECDIAGEWEYI